MKEIFWNKYFLNYFLFFFLLNIFLYFFIYQFHNLLPFNKENYIKNAHHFIADPRIRGGDFKFLNALGQFDAQWYLKIAAVGYPKNPQNTDMGDKNTMGGLTYAFFPFYPLIIRVVNLPINNLELSAFIISNSFLIVNFFSGYFVITKLFSREVAIRTLFLLFFFPLSIFYRSYFTENIYLFLLFWFSYFFINNKYLIASIFLSLLNITKGNLLFLSPLFLIVSWREIVNHRLFGKVLYFLLLTIVVFTPFTIWSVFNYIQTNNFFYFQTIQQNWNSGSYLLNPLTNLIVISYFFQLPTHSFHASKIDVLVLILTAYLLIKSFYFIPRKLWLISFLIWVTPLIVKADPLSYARYQIISFPLFVYIATNLKGTIFYTLLSLFYLGLLCVSIYFVNWYWIG